MDNGLRAVRERSMIGAPVTKPTYVCTITEEDVRDPKDGPLARTGLRCRVLTAIGRVQACDVGKRVYRVPTEDGTSDIIQVESREQRDRRLAKK